jgi:hypothetical protein
MPNYKIQFNNSNNGDDAKSISELVKESFKEKQPVVDLSFFYEEGKEPETIHDVKIQFPTP